MFVAAIAVATADTLASELGVFSRTTVWVWAPWEQAPRGANGGVSALGQLAALFGATLIGSAAYLAFPLLGGGLTFTFAGYLLTVVAGFLGCQLDSVLGGTLENRGLLTGSRVNLLSIFVMAMVVYALGQAQPALFLGVPSPGG